MSLILYEVVDHTGMPFGQFGLRTRMALGFMGVSFDAIGVQLSDITALGVGSHAKLPILVDNETIVEDSWSIAVYLSEKYPQRPALFGSSIALAMTHHFNAWMDQTVVPTIAPLVITDVVERLDARDAEHLRAGFERMFRQSIASLSHEREARRQKIRRILGPVRSSLKTRAYIAGDGPRYPDFVFFSLFKWLDLMADFDPLEGDEVIGEWRERMRQDTMSYF